MAAPSSSTFGSSMIFPGINNAHIEAAEDMIINIVGNLRLDPDLTGTYREFVIRVTRTDATFYDIADAVQAPNNNSNAENIFSVVKLLAGESISFLISHDAAGAIPLTLTSNYRILRLS